jgi:hypothetical protein
MNKLRWMAAWALLAANNPLLAEDIQPGLWKISVEARVAATPDWKPDPFEITQCLTEAEAKNPDQLLAGFGTQGASGCDYLNRQYSGNTVKFELSCAGALALKGHGEVGFSATSMDGTLEVSFVDAAQGGQATAMRNKLHAVYLGDCPATSASRLPALPPGVSLPTITPPAPSAE